MPVWGNRVVVETANYRHIEEKKKEFLERENSLAKWMKEKEERKTRLHRLNERLRQGSISSTYSGPSFRNGSVDMGSIDGDADENPDVRPSTAAITAQPIPHPAETKVRPANQPRSASLTSSVEDAGDRAHIIGEGQADGGHPCGQCSIM